MPVDGIDVTTLHDSGPRVSAHWARVSRRRCGRPEPAYRARNRERAARRIELLLVQLRAAMWRAQMPSSPVLLLADAVAPVLRWLRAVRRVVWG